jgi:Uma2 family endonuclease
VYRLSADQYDLMISAGVLSEDDPVELIDGKLVAKMPRNSTHIVSVRKSVRALESMIPAKWFVAKEDVLKIGLYSKPEPDAMVVRRELELDSSRDPIPADCALVVEVADSSLLAHRTEKAMLYSSGNIPLYLIVNLVDSQLEVYSEPGPSGYQTRRDFGLSDQVSVVLEGQEFGRIAVADLMP